MEIKDLLRKTDRQIDYYENYNFYKDMSKIEDMDYFIKVMDSKNSNKLKIENGIIWMSLKEDKEDFEIMFLKKYTKYLEMVLENDIREYYNNSYCSYLFENFWNSLKTEEDFKSKKFINGKSFEEIDTLISNKYNEIIERFYKEEEISDEDKKFLEETFLITVYNDAIFKELDGEEDLMIDIVKYFKKYPIENINTPRKRQLYLLYLLSSKMLELPNNNAIQFYESFDKKVLGSYSKNKDGIAIIRINDLDIYNITTEKEFLEKIFTIFHELGHYKQDIEYDQYTDDIKRIITIEKYLAENDREFYNKYHDSFVLEKDADNYATIEIIKEFGKKHPKLVSNIIERKQKTKKIDSSEFYNIELEEYKKLTENRKRSTK